MDPRRFTKITEGIEVRESWPGGPLREFAKKRPHNTWGLHYDNAEWPWAGAYVCGRCKETAEGVHQVSVAAKTQPRTPGIGWLCAACKEMATSSAA
jgi:hypothetical protein